MNAWKRLAVSAVACWLGTTALAADELYRTTLVAKDGTLSPAVIEVPAGRKIRLEVRNAGSTPIEVESNDIRIEKVLAPGATSFVVIYPLKPGRYALFDDFHPDTGKATLVVK